MEALNIVGGADVAVTGLEPNEHKRAAAKTRGMDLVFFDTTEHDRTYDVISALNVFSHLPDPREDIGQWVSMLNEGGELFLQTGDSSHLEAKHHHKPYSLPDHLSFASETLLVEMLESLGLEVVQVMKYRMGMFPRFTPVNIVKEIARFFLPGHTATFQFFPKHPERDMYIRARSETCASMVNISRKDSLRVQEAGFEPANPFPKTVTDWDLIPAPLTKLGDSCADLRSPSRISTPRPFLKPVRRRTRRLRPAFSDECRELQHRLRGSPPASRAWLPRALADQEFLEGTPHRVWVCVTRPMVCTA